MIVIVAAVALSIVRLAIPYAEDFKRQIELAVSEAIGREVSISEIDASWRHFKPQIELSNVSISLSDEQELEFGRMALGVDLIGSATAGSLVTNDIRLAGFELYVVEDLGGRLSLAGLPQSTKKQSGERNREFIRWLFDQQQIIVENGTIYVTSEKRPELLHIFSQFGVYLVNSDDQKQLSISVVLPKELGGNIQLVSNFNGVPLLENDWSIDSYLKVSGVSLQGVEGEFFSHSNEQKIRGGEFDFELWAGIDSDQNIEGQGFLNGRGLRIDSGLADKPGRELVITQASADFALNKLGQKWAFAFAPLHVARAGAADQYFDLQLLYDDDISNRSLTLQSGSFKPADVISFVKDSSFLTEQQLAEINKVVFKANVEQAVLHWQQQNKPKVFAFAEFNNFDLEKTDSLPGISGLSGSVRIHGDKGQVVLLGEAAVLDAPQWFRDPLQFQQLTADVSWSSDADEVVLNVDDIHIANPDLTLSGALAAHLPNVAANSPYIDAQFDVEYADIAKRQRYLPAKLMPEKSLKWYDRALRGGHLSQGKITLHGDLAAFPFKSGGGQFSVDAHINNGDLAYTKGWPALEQIDADLRIRNAAIEVLANRGKMFSTTIHQAKMSVADFSVKPAIMTVTGQASGPSSDALLFLGQSPLKERFKNSLDVLSVEGVSEVSLQLDIPIPGRTEVSGQMELIDNRLSVANDEFVASEINGELGFDNRGLNGQAIVATILDMPVKVDIEPIIDGDKRGTKFTGYGKGDIATYAKLSGLPWLREKAEGGSEWKAQVDIVGGQPELYVESDLVGVSSRFPYPFSKNTGEIKTFSLATTLPFGSELVELSFGSDIQAEMLVRSENDVNYLSILNVGVNARPARLVAGTQGIFVNGELDSLVLEEWLDLADVVSDEGQSGGSLPMDISLALSEADLFGYKWKNIVSHSKFVNGQWDITADGEGLRGVLQTNGHGSDAHISLRMDELAIATTALPKQENDGSGENLDPQVLPTFDVRVDKFKFDQLDLGQVAFTSSRIKQGQHIGDIAIRSETFLMAGAGNWTRIANDQRSSFNVTVESEDLAKMLEQLDYASDNIRGGQALLTANVFWQGAPTDYSHSRLNGQLGLTVNDINFSDIDPGAGRVFGLLSIQALPQRLSLDFSDLFKKGLQIKAINGNFAVKNGDAVTDDLVMQGTAARIDLAGRIGLVEQDYDQILAVTPEVGSSLPLVGAAVAGPAGAGVGTAIMFLHKLFNPKILHYKYQITGSWDDPQVVQLKSTSDGNADEESASNNDDR